MLNNEIINAILFISEKSNLLGLNYLIGGSGALMLHGVKVTPSDIDLIVDPSTYDDAICGLKQYLTGKTQTKGKLLKTPFEVLGVRGEILNFTINGNDLTKINIKGKLIPVNKLEIELSYYKARKDKINQNQKTIKLIEEVLNARL